MKKLFQELKRRMEEKKDSILLTIIASSGSTPQGEGAHMLVGHEGRIIGTIGGGAVEYRCEQMAKESLQEKKNSTKAFKLDRGDVENLGMICGGDVTVFFKYISFDDSRILELCNKIIEAYNRDSDIWLIADITDSINSTFGCYSKENGFFGIQPECDFEKLISKRSVLVAEGEKTYYSEPIASGGNVIIFGGGHIAQELVPLLSHLEFHCIVMDDREEFANRGLFPQADKIICGSFENIFAALDVGDNDYAVVLTRGHASDYIVERQLHNTRAGYIGVIGSRKKMATVFEKLRVEGVSEEELKKVHTPIGTAIKAQSPGEIAVSIAGELILERSTRKEER